MEYGVYGDLFIIYQSHILSTSGGLYTVGSKVRVVWPLLQPHLGPTILPQAQLCLP